MKCYSIHMIIISMSWELNLLIYNLYLQGRKYGSSATAILNHCERYSLENKTWEIIAEMNKPRSTFFTIIYHKIIYIFGGYTGNKKRSKSIEYYCNDAQKWVKIKLKLKYGIEQGVLINKEDDLLILGGQDAKGPSRQIMHLNLTEMKTHIKAWHTHDARVLAKGFQNNNIIYLFGGDKQNTCEKGSYHWLRQFVPRNDNLLPPSQQFQSYTLCSAVLDIQSTLEKKKDDNQQLIKQSSILLPPERKQSLFEENQFLYNRSHFIFNYSNIIRIDMSSLEIQVYQTEEQLPNYMGGVNIPKFEDNKQEIIIFGGINSSMNKIYNNTKLFRFQKSNLTITNLSNMIQGRFAFGYIKVGDFIYAIGGRNFGGDDQAILPHVERYSIKQNEWVVLAQLNIGRCSPMIFSHQKQIFVAGGYKGNKQREDSIEIYESEQNVWYLLGISLPIKIEASFLYKKEISDDCFELLLFGGRTLNGDSNQVWNLNVQWNKSFDEQGTLKDEKFYEQLGSKSCLIKGVEYENDQIMLLFELHNSINLNIMNLNSGKRVVNDKKVQKFLKKLNELKNKNCGFSKMLLV